MNKPSRHARAQGLAVVRKGTMLVAAVCVVGTGAFAAIEAKAYAATHPSGPTTATSSATVQSHESHDSQESHDSHESDDGQGNTFSQPLAAPTNAGGSPAQVVSGGS